MARKQRKSRISKEKLAGIFIVIIMVGSAFGVVLGSFAGSSDSFKYNGIRFKQTSQGYSVKIGEKQYLFRYDPRVLEKIEVDQKAIDAIKDSPQVDFTSDTDSYYKEVIAQIEFSFERVLTTMNKHVETGFTGENDYGKDVLVCGDTGLVPLIYFKESNTTRISYENSCVIAEADSAESFLALTERMMYGLLGVI